MTSLFSSFFLLTVMSVLLTLPEKSPKLLSLVRRNSTVQRKRRRGRVSGRAEH